MKVNRPLLFSLVQVIIFIMLRYVSIITIVLNRSGPDAKYSIWDYVPAYLIQVIFLVWLALRKSGINGWSVLLLLNILILSILFLAGHFDYLPSWLVPT